MNSNVSIVIPVYNEELHIENVVESVEKYCENIIVVDDKSTDSSLDILKKLETKYSKKIFILENEKNSGIGYSVKKGFSKALELDNDIVIKFDGDNQHLPEDIPKFIEKITKEGFDFVKGNRFLNNAYSKPMPNLKILGNLITTNLQKIVSGNYAISDPNNGFLGVKKECLNIIDFKNLKNNYFFENSLLINMSSLGLKIGEVPIQTIYQNEKSSIPEGAVLPMGNYKGFGLSLFCEILGGLLSGGKTIQPGHDRLGGVVNNMMSILIDPKYLVEDSALNNELESLIDYIKSSPNASDDVPVMLPGEIEQKNMKYRLKNGIPIDDKTFEQILRAGDSLNVKRPNLIV